MSRSFLKEIFEVMEGTYLKSFVQFFRQHERQTILILSFLVPALIMGSYFAYRHMAPFGSSSLLTVDLGQQYVDFFAYFRHSLLRDPSGIFYTFQKALGGEMFGIWTYYLLSPFNLILLLFPDKSLTSAIFGMTILKYGAAGFTFTWLLIKTKVQPHFPALAFSTSYALMGWMIANQLNLMWLDAIIILPLIIWGLIQLVNNGKWRTYVTWLALLLIVNYYMAYMVCIFTVCFFIYLLVSKHTAWRDTLATSARFAISSLLAGAISAITLLPTWAALKLSKTQYTTTDWHLKFEYFPPKMIAKFFMGTFNFSQMPKGTPNLFIGSIALLGAVFYFLQRRQTLKSRITAGLITLFLVTSLCFEPLDLLWHGMQFPIWYPYRFSFVVSFWLIWLAANALQPDFVPQRWQIGVVTIIFVAGISYVWLNLKSFSFLSQNQLLIGTLLLVAAGCLVALPNRSQWFYQLAFICFAFIELGSNAVTSLNHISYVTQPEYQNYQQVMTTQVNAITNKHNEMYRMTPTFMRTKNDPLSGQFNGGSVFSSTLEKQMPTFMGNIGNPDGDGFVTYTNGTELTDALLNMRYFINQQDQAKTKSLSQSVVTPVSTRPDLKAYKRIRRDGLMTSYQNQNALPIGFIASNSIRHLKNDTKDPTKYQANLWAALTGNKHDRQLFTAQNFNRVVFQNVKQQTKLTGAILQKSNVLKPGVVTFYFTPKTNDSYYLTLGANLIDDNVTISLNNHTLNQYPTYRHTIIVNVARQQKGKTVKLQLSLKKGTLWLQNFTLYQFNNQQFQSSLQRLKNAPLKVTHHSQSSLDGNVKVNHNNATLMTTVPYSTGWRVKVDGKDVQAHRVAGTFTAIKLNKGHHRISFTYWPPLFTLGSIITTCALVIVVGTYVLKRKRRP